MGGGRAGGRIEMGKCLHRVYGACTKGTGRCNKTWRGIRGVPKTQEFCRGLMGAYKGEPGGDGRMGGWGYVCEELGAAKMAWNQGFAPKRWSFVGDVGDV